MIGTTDVNGFFYAGAVPHQLATLVEVYQRGHAAETLGQAKRDLSRPGAAVPELICCSAAFGFSALSSFAQFLAAEPGLAAVPFVIDAEGLDTSDHIHLVRSRIADDIVVLKDTDTEALQRKFRFLHKFKTRAESPGRPLHPDYPLQPEPAGHFLLKRGFDMLVATVLLVILGPLLIIISLAIWAESGGPIFYISRRAGKGYRIFNFYKFRTMVPGADQDMAGLAHLNQYNGHGSPFFKLENDPRVTRLGRLLRNSSLDELPQLFNVLLGDMSLVGNRPLPLYEAASLTTNEMAKRFLAPAGITGLWQIKKRGQSRMSVEERLNLDIDYATRSNFLYDLWIMANTPQALLQKANA